MDENGTKELEALTEKGMKELEANGVLEKLSPEWRERIDPEDPALMLQGRIACCRAAGSQFVTEETQLPRADGSVARFARVSADPRYTSCILLSLRSSAEALLATGLTKYRRISFFVSAEGDGRAALYEGLGTLNGMYERIEFIPLGADGKPSGEDAANGKNGEKDKKQCFLKKLFRRR